MSRRRPNCQQNNNQENVKLHLVTHLFLLIEGCHLCKALSRWMFFSSLFEKYDEQICGWISSWIASVSY